MRIIVAEEKHGRRYLDASTEEQWARSAQDLLRDRFKQGEYDPEPGYVTKPIRTDAEIAALPADLRPEAERVNAINRRSNDWHERTADFYARVKAAVEQPVPEMIVERYKVVRNPASGRLERTGVQSWQPLAWSLLLERSKHEYESVDLETVEAPGAEKAAAA